MVDNRTPSQTGNAFCIGCGYSLRRLPANRCPECGREFDPANPLTMNMGRPLRPWQRWLLKPIGWPTIAPAILGTIGLMYLSGWPRLTIVPWSVLHGEFNCHWLNLTAWPLTLPDAVFYAAVICWAFFMLSVILWLFARTALVPLTARRSNIVGCNPRRRNRLITVAMVLTACSMIFGWQERIGRRWITRVLSPGGNLRYAVSNPLLQMPVVLTPKQSRQVLASYIAGSHAPTNRLAAMAVLVESDGAAALPALVRSAANEKDADLLVWELHLIGLCRDPSTASHLTGRLQDPRPHVRAAAADAIGILRQPAYSVGIANRFFIGQPLALDSIPPITVEGIVSRDLNEHDLLDEPAIAVDPSIRAILQGMMIDGATPDEREAAARALVTWPPQNFHLRVAEWGIWMNKKGQMALAQSLIDEIPPFVHGTGNPASSFDSCFLYPTMVTKPIIHLTSDVPLSVDMEVHIHDGRPWFAYPRPDDLAIGNEYVQRGRNYIPPAPHGAFGPKNPDDFEAPAIPSLPDCHEGYPWIIPHHRIYSSSSAGMGGSAAIYELGLRWQSLIVCPQRQAWMMPPAVPNDPKFRWWSRLREVPSDWVCNRGETERFLYYDGPTRADVPVTVTLGPSGRQLCFTYAPLQYSASGSERYPTHPFQPMAPVVRNDLPLHEAIYIEVRSDTVRGQVVPVTGEANVDLASDLPLQGNAVVERLRQMLTTYGLTAPEAEGLIDAWSAQFFHTEGRRLLLRMSAEDYARQCPMQVRPTPTEVVRLGLVLTEFDPKSGPSN